MSGGGAEQKQGKYGEGWTRKRIREKESHTLQILPKMITFVAKDIGTPKPTYT